MKYTAIFLSIMISLNCFGQKQAKNDSIALAMFNQGLEFLDNGKEDSALAIWSRIVNKKIGMANSVYGNAYFNVASVYWKKGEKEKAKEWYKAIIASDLKDNDKSLDLSEPHTNYKHKSAVALAGLYAMESNFEEALTWITLADTVYRYWGFEGSASSAAEEEGTVLAEETDLLLRLKRKEDAIHNLLFQLICSGNLEQLFQDSEPKLLALVDRKTFKTELDQAINASTIEKQKGEMWTINFTLRGQAYTIPVSKMQPDKNIPLYHKIIYVDKSQEVNKKYFVDYIDNRSFYKDLNG